ncbi:MAG: hypothetical protein ACI9N1_000737 [Flavobacteriales bacterium]|jgi:hypothetical protein
MSLQDLSLRSVKSYNRFKEFNLQTHHIVELILRYIIGFNYKKIKKISISILPFEPKVMVLDAGNVMLIKRKVDLDPFFELSDLDKSYYLLDLIVDSLSLLYKGNKPLESMVSNAYKLCLEKKCTNEFIHGEITYSINKNYYGYFICHHKINVFEIEGQIYDNEGIIVFSKTIVSCAPYWLEYSEFLGHVIWEDCGLVLYDTSKSEKIICEFKGN